MAVNIKKYFNRLGSESKSWIAETSLNQLRYSPKIGVSDFDSYPPVSKEVNLNLKKADERERFLRAIELNSQPPLILSLIQIARSKKPFFSKDKLVLKPIFQNVLP